MKTKHAKALVRMEKSLISLSLSLKNMETKAREIRVILVDFHTALRLADFQGFSEGYADGYSDGEIEQ